MKNTKRKDLAICGLEAVKALAIERPADIMRLFFTEERAREFGTVCSMLAREKRPYRKTDASELEKISGTVHHQGVVAIVPERKPLAISDAIIESWSKNGARIAVLDRVGDDHNLGSIARSAAFFGWSAIVLPDDHGSAGLSTSAYRIARGALEKIPVYGYPDAASFALRCGKKILTVGTDHAANTEVSELSAKLLEDRTRALALFLGNEESGLSEKTRKACQLLVSIAGAGPVESLNVSQAAAVCFFALKPA